MALLTPNLQASPPFDAQAIADETDLIALAAAANGTGVTLGCQVIQDTGSDMKVAVAAGTVYVLGVQYTVAGTGGSPLTIAAASASDRKDIVVYTVGTGLQVIQGTACGTAGWTRSTAAPLTTNPPPVKPSIPANSVLLGEVYVASTTTVIATATNVIDKTANIQNLSIGALVVPPITARAIAASQFPSLGLNPAASCTEWTGVASGNYIVNIGDGCVWIANPSAVTIIKLVPAAVVGQPPTATTYSVPTAPNKLCRGPDGLIWYGSTGRVCCLDPKWIANVASCTTTNTSPVVTLPNTSALTQGVPIGLVGAPPGCYVGTIVTNTSFRLSSSPTAQVDVPAIASGTVTATLGLFETAIAATSAGACCAGPDGRIWFGAAVSSPTDAIGAIAFTTIAGATTGLTFPVIGSTSATLYPLAAYPAWVMPNATASLTSGSPTVNVTPASSFPIGVLGATVTDSAGKIPANTTVTGYSQTASPNTLTLSNNATGNASGATLTFSNFIQANASKGPGAVAVGPDGSVWFIEGANNGPYCQIGKINPYSGAIAEYPLPAYIAGPASGTFPQSLELNCLCCGPDGRMWAGENGPDRMLAFKPWDNTFDDYKATFFNAPRGVIAGADNNVWEAAEAINSLTRFNLDGSHTDFAGATSPQDLCIGPDGNIWYVGASHCGTLLFTLPQQTAQVPGGLGIYGDGSDGVITFDGTTTVLGLAPSSSVYTLARDILLAGGSTINSGVTIVTNGFRIYCQGTLVNNGAIGWNGNNGGNGTTVGGTGGTALTSSTSSINGPASSGNIGAPGGAGATGAGSTGGALTHAAGGAGGHGATGSSAGGTGGTVTAPTAAAGTYRALPAALTGQVPTPGTGAVEGLLGGAGGGGGGGDATNAGGGGGGGGGPVIVIAWAITGTGTISSNGGKGGNGNTTGNTGGGGGGGGGPLWVVSGSVVGGAIVGQTITATGGAVGTAHGTGGASGTAGANGNVVLIPN